MITLREAALLYDTNERNILHWAKKNNITVTRYGESWMVDDIAISKLFAHNIRWGNEYLEEELKVREEVMSNALLQIDDLIYLFKSVKEIAPFLRLLIDEMAMLIPNEQKRAIFTEVVSGKGISTVAKNHGISFDKACYLYNSALSIIKNHIGFLTNYRDILAEKELEIKKLSILVTNQKNHINTLHTFMDKQQLISYDWITNIVEEHIPRRIVCLLAINVHTGLQLDTRILNCLRGLEINTVEDLVRFIRNEGLNKFLSCRNLGMKSLKILKAELLKHGIINKDGNSELFAYIEPGYNQS